MFQKKLLALLLACLLLPVLGGHAAALPGNEVHPLQERHFQLDRQTGLGYVDNLLVLLLPPGVSERTALSWFPGEQARVVGRFPALRQIQVQIRPRTRQDLQALANALMQRRQVVYAHLELAGSTADPQSRALLHRQAEAGFSEPAYGDPPSQREPGQQWWHGVIGLAQTQRRFPLKSVLKAGVVDDGFDTSHPALRLAFVSPQDQRQNLPETHGTHVAGILAQILPGASITVTDAYRIPGLDPNAHLFTQCQMLKTLVDQVEHGVRVINYSMGQDIEDDRLLPWNEASSAIFSVYLHLLTKAGHDFLVVQSAGNMGIDAARNGMFCSITPKNCLDHPVAQQALGVADHLVEAQQAVLDRIVVVAASDKQDHTGRYPLCYGSNHGSRVTIAAPGELIYSSVPGGYQLSGGTSQAAPIITGALTYLWSLKPSLTGPQVRSILLKTATPDAVYQTQSLAKDTRGSYPLVNLLAAAQMVADSKDP